MSEPHGSWLERLWYRPHPSGPLAVFVPLLRLAAAVFGWFVARRDAMFRRGLRRPTRVPARVISVGNLNVGGAGKTPVVIALAERLTAAGVRVAVLSRGYGGTGREAVVSDGLELKLGFRDAGDEPVLIARRVPQAVVLVGPSRVRLAKRAIEELGCSTLVLDDGFQHRQLARDEDVVVLGGPSPLGSGELMPLGPLREPVSALARATVAWLSNVPEKEVFPSELPERVIRSRTHVVDVLDWLGRESFGPNALRGQKVFLLAGLARPSGFARTLKALGAEVVGRSYYGDHHAYSVGALRAVAARAYSAGATVIATTEKDAVRMEKTVSLHVPVRVVRVDLQVYEGEDVLRELLGL